MKPTVINNNSENPHQPQHDHHQQNVDHNQANNGQANNDHSRRFPQFRQHGFGFDDPDGDVFADMGLRSRLNRMGNPFDWSARKRRGSGQNLSDAYDHHYFDDVDFPFGSTWDAFGRMGKRHPAESQADRSGFFDYVPQEFRQYVPEHFGSHFRRDDGRHPQQPPPQQQQQQQPPPPSSQQQSQQQQAPTQQQQAYQPTGSKSNLCDAAIQTDDLGAQNNGDRRDGPNQPEHDNRNGSNANRSSSSASSSSTSTPYGNQVHMSTSADGPGAYANASAGNNQNQYYQQSPNYAHQAPPYGRHYQQPYGTQYQYTQSPQQNQYYGQPPPQQQQQPPPQQQQQQPHPSDGGFVRNVPIVLEETGTPVNKTTTASAATSPPPSTSQTGSNKARPEPLNKESFASNEPIPMPCPQHMAQQQEQQQQHSDTQANADSAPPQTPHTADCISKIQAIQRDVLELMLAVEQFGGKRGDKDYLYLDEMLTRNLLKLDTIDTNGKESIRLARKEAIKCIQTSIAVLEAKSDLHLNEKRDSIDQSNKEQTENDANAAQPPPSSDAKPTEKMDVDETNGEQSKADKAEQNTDSNTEIPKVENISIDEKPSNGNGNGKGKGKSTKSKTEENSATAEKADAKK